MKEQEGVIKFELEHDDRALVHHKAFDELNAWRGILRALGLVGADPNRYGGFGFGNLSVRQGHGFIITGSQTGDFTRLDPGHFAHVLEADVEHNRLVARGATRPSSESLTHAAVYEQNETVSAVFHVHSPAIWHSSIASTPSDVPYGTPQMAVAVARVIRGSEGIFKMLGHEDGVVSYGTSCEAAGLLLVAALAKTRHADEHG